MNRGFRRLLPWGGIAFAAWLTLARPSHAQPTSAYQVDEARDVVPMLISFVGQNGWSANMGRMCTAFGLSMEGDCRFKQIAVSGRAPGTIDNHGFNVPSGGPGHTSEVVIFHLGPLVGNFFVVSSAGELKAAYYRAKNVDFTPIAIEEAERAFGASIAFWKENLPRLKEDAARGALQRR